MIPTLCLIGRKVLDVFTVIPPTHYGLFHRYEINYALNRQRSVSSASLSDALSK